MLQISTVKPACLEILKQLMLIPELASFCLAGGTALALKYGHRESVDLDLFASADFENEKIATAIARNFPTFSYRTLTNPIGVFGFIDEVKVDFVKYHYHPLIKQHETIDGIRILQDEDLIAMKINAILRRGVKKDFWDISELLHHYPLSSFIEFYQEKYIDQYLPISIPQALIYFADAEESEAPKSLKGQTWEKVKKNIQRKVSEFLN